MVSFSDLGNIIDIAENVTQVAENLSGGNDEKETSRLGPIRGARLEYNIPALGGRLLMKEPFGYWFKLEPVYPEYGIFESGEYQQGKSFTKRAGFRFKSYTILLKPGTQMEVPKAKAQEQRRREGENGKEKIKVGNISIGVSSNVTVKEFIEWLRTSSKKKEIIGVISPTLRKYQWGGVLHQAK